MPDRPVGRPREFDGTPVSIRLPKALHDDLSREALRRRCDLSDVMRERLSVSQKQQQEKSSVS